MKPRLQVITASTREARKGPLVAEWLLDHACRHGGFEVEALDLAQIGLPIFDEPAHPRLRAYQHAHTKAWSRTVERADAFVFVMPEYDYGPPAALINALQYLVHEWAYKPVAFVSYGGVAGGTRAVQVTKLTVTTLKMVPVLEAVAIPFFAQHIDEDTGRFEPGEVQAKAARVMLDELLKWAVALAPMRAPPDERGGS